MQMFTKGRASIRRDLVERTLPHTAPVRDEHREPFVRPSILSAIEDRLLNQFLEQHPNRDRALDRLMKDIGL